MGILQGDALSILRTLADESVHCVVTSPPYWGLRDYGVEGQLGLEKTPEEYVEKLTNVFREVRRVLRKDGTLWLNLGDSYCAAKGESFVPGSGGQSNRKSFRRDKASVIPKRTGVPGLKPKDLVGIPWRVAFALQRDGWWLRSEIIWHKPNCMPESVKDRPTRNHEQLFLFAKSERYHFGDFEEPAKYHGPNGAVKSPFGQGFTRSGNKYRKTRPQPGLKDGALAGGIPWEGKPTRRKRSVWTVTTRPFKGAHFATFPEKLIEPCILAGCPEGGTVLDPFFGAGTTGVVALKHRREFVGIELNPQYIEMAEKRLQGVQMELA